MKVLSKLRFAVLRTLLIFGFSVLPSQAKITRGVISGTVPDENGAVVPGAQVTITSTGNSLTKREAITDDQGFYRVGALDPGSYNVVVQKDGFEKLENRDIAVKSAGEGTFDAALKTGDLTTPVDVTTQTEAVTLDKTSPTIGLTATSRQAVNLPR